MALNPSFEVPAEYFYVLGAGLPIGVKPEKRFQLATAQKEADLAALFTEAIDDAIISESGLINRFQAARRLPSLSPVGVTEPRCTIPVPSDQFDLIQDWLDDTGADIRPFWNAVPGDVGKEKGHLELVLAVITREHVDLMNAIRAWPVASVDTLAGKSESEWNAFFRDASGNVKLALLPPFTAPGTPEQRVNAFIQHLRRYFSIKPGSPSGTTPTIPAPASLPRPANDLLELFVSNYTAISGVAFLFGTAFNAGHLNSAIDTTLPQVVGTIDVSDARAWLRRAVIAINDLYMAADIGIPELRFSIAEALYARGFTCTEDICAMATWEDLRDALTGTIAYEHAQDIMTQAGGPSGVPAVETPETFQPINHDGKLEDCVPPEFRSTLGRVQYLRELLAIEASDSCKESGWDTRPIDDGARSANCLAELLSTRIGDIASLKASRANLETPIPHIDLVNERLELLTASAPAALTTIDRDALKAGYDTAPDTLAGHSLEYHDLRRRGHEPSRLFQALPEHSSPAVPVKQEVAYTNLGRAFTSPILPYSQPLDVSRSYLHHLGTSRYATLRRFRKEITEFVLDPENPSAEFQSHRWRYPVRIEIGIERLGISPEEYELLYSTGSVLTDLHLLYGFDTTMVDGIDWIDIVARVPEFLKRTGLSYCEFREFNNSMFIEFRITSADGLELPECESCDLEGEVIEFEDPSDIEEALKRAIVFIRLWRKLREFDAFYSFDALADICKAFELFDSGGDINPDFLRQLVAFQLLRDHFDLSLTDGVPQHVGSGVDRTHLLSLWDEAASKHEWALELLLSRVQHYARARHECDCRTPEFMKILKENLNPLSKLAGFDPFDEQAGNHCHWDAKPTHTLRFAEVLSKIYASPFQVSEVLYLFSADKHLAGDDPFPLSSDNEALESPLDYADDNHEFDLWSLRKKLIAVSESSVEPESWNWKEIHASLKNDFGYHEPASGAAIEDATLIAIGSHFFPSILRSSGVGVTTADERFGVALATTNAAMWNTPAAGPFQYDGSELFCRIPLSDAEVCSKLNRVRELSDDEKQAVRDVYFAPRALLVKFAFLFEDWQLAERSLIEEPLEQKRWEFFRTSFANYYRRAKVVAEHIASHVSSRGYGDNDEIQHKIVWKVLRKLHADENSRLTTENDSGDAPAVSLDMLPRGGAFSVLVGLAGCGLVGDYRRHEAGKPNSESTISWREIRGITSAFGEGKNSRNAPVPTLFPSLDTKANNRSVVVRNGFAINDQTGEPLGGADGYNVSWSGMFFVENSGKYTFHASGPSPDGEKPASNPDRDESWFLKLKRGQKEWIVLRHEGDRIDASSDCQSTLSLRRGAYEVEIRVAKPARQLDESDTPCVSNTGFELKYEGPDTQGAIVHIPSSNLFPTTRELDFKPKDVNGKAAEYLDNWYVHSIRDIRRTYQRAFKASLFLAANEISPTPISDDGTSELVYLLDNPDEFKGYSYYKNGAWSTHNCQFILDLIPILDNFHRPSASKDKRAKPSMKRQQALFDWWERLFDFTRLRMETHKASERPVWLLFHEAKENHPDDSTHLLRHMGIDEDHASKVFNYWDSASSSTFLVDFDELLSEQWPVRIWMAEKWLRQIELKFPFGSSFESKLRPNLWGSDNPSRTYPTETASGNELLTSAVRLGYLEPIDQPKYEPIVRINDELRLHAKEAMLSFVCGNHRLNSSISTIGVVDSQLKLSELLLMALHSGTSHRESRIDSAIQAVQTFVHRARLGLELDFLTTPHFVKLWTSRFETFCKWKACKGRELYKENWIEWRELDEARKTEGFQLLESELRSGLTPVASPGGMMYWPERVTVDRTVIKPSQARRPSRLSSIDPSREGFDSVEERERAANPTWLARLGEEQEQQLPLPAKAAIKLGRKFVRVAAAGVPTANFLFKIPGDSLTGNCCVSCEDVGPQVDEYYFWLEEATEYLAVKQDSRINSATEDAKGNRDEGTDWHRPEELPKLLAWNNEEIDCAVSLVWTRLRRGEFSPVRRSSEVLRVKDLVSADIELVGREGDVLWFNVIGGIRRIGHSDSHEPGFMYSMQTDLADVLPKVVTPSSIGSSIGGLTSYPFFAYFVPGARLTPTSLYSPSLALSITSKSRCQFEESLQWLEIFFNPLARDNSQVGPVSDVTARRRSIALRYSEILVEWGNVMLRNGESHFARLIFATASRLLGEAPKRTTQKYQPSWSGQTIASFTSDGAGLNPRLIALYETVATRLHDLNYAISRQTRTDFAIQSACCDGNTNLTVQGAADCSSESNWCLPSSPYRFSVLLQKFAEFANDLRTLGSGLLSAFEKGDAEYLAALRATNEHQLLELTLQIRQLQWREADWQVQALEETKESAMTRRRYVDGLLQRGLISKETEYETLTELSMAMLLVSQASEIAGQWIGVTPDMWIGHVGPLPSSYSQIPTGSKLASVFATAARVSSFLSQEINLKAGMDLTQAGWQRREEEWRHQVEVLDIEIEQIERQILAAERRRDAALRELNNHQRQIDHAKEITDFVRDKFTNHALYLWMQQETSSLFQEMYYLTLHLGKQAEQHFNLERGYPNRKFVSSKCWDDLHEGLLCGERLQLAARQMDKAYTDENVRELELTKHFSLRSQFPREFLQLRQTGTCEIDIPEWMFDLDYPGHFLRRIRNISLTIPCVAGPYTGVHCRLTLLQSHVRKDSRLSTLTSRCCDHNTLASDGYRRGLNDTRFITLCGAKEAIATSTGQNDSGMFEVSFRDERYLPFEYSGTISRWRIELPHENNFFDFDSLSDVVVRMSYTARDGGPQLRNASTLAAANRRPRSDFRLVEVQREMPESIRRRKDQNCQDVTEVDIAVDPRLFPFAPPNRPIRIEGVTVVFSANPSSSQYREIQVDLACGSQTMVRCISDSALANVFVGVIPLKATMKGKTTLGMIRIPDESTKLVLIFNYELP
jgi:hypothetical protein